MPTDASIISQMPSLKRKGEKFFNVLERDATELEALVYDEAAKTAFRNALDAVENLTWDETLEAFKMAHTADKVAVGATLERTIRTIFNMAPNHFGIHSAKYRAFEPFDITRQRDADLARTYKITATKVAANLAELASEGLSQTMIDLLNTKEGAYDSCLDATAQGISDRDMATKNRISTLNHPYQLLTKYARIGQDIFYDVSAAKYNDYVIYSTPNEQPKNTSDI